VCGELAFDPSQRLCAVKKYILQPPAFEIQTV
jgi:hypothetical protein